MGVGFGVGVGVGAAVGVAAGVGLGDGVTGGRGVGEAGTTVPAGVGAGDAGVGDDVTVGEGVGSTAGALQATDTNNANSKGQTTRATFTPPFPDTGSSQVTPCKVVPCSS